MEERTTIRLEQYEGFLIKRLNNKVNGTLIRTFSEKYGITASQWGVMVILYDHPGMTSKEIQNIADIKVSSASGILKRMLKKKLLYKKTLSKDHRASLLYLTEYSKKLVPSLINEANEFHAKMFSNFTDHERENFRFLLQKVYNNMK
ncbi:MarR family winged helix-turn-helix transcriptional regulator [Apilactobacillus timberlakei]|uniref:MarR family winged helix-turn-helix transcriptional regulator n=1 Tax=Apilactobacillus timberlakei TaxID=2008380 RepID=UPI00112E7CF3|nr:MarR family transcriptional regulator [Apilactobacillus timberlakei]TPR19293.1 MarR family transcriptional regulator [Apilactobacillus timberlakei]